MDKTSAAATQVVESGNVLAYRAIDGVYDEMSAVDGTIREAWQSTANWFVQTDLAEQQSRVHRIDRLVSDNFSDPARAGAPWQLNLAPLVLDGATWAMLERAAIQRARLYDRLIADLYGERNGIAAGVIPDALVLSDPAYLRPLVGGPSPAGHLSFLAVDFARNPAGDWRVIDVHAETPAGIGYVIANRMIHAQVCPGMFRGSRAHRIGKFIQDLGDDLLSRAGGEQPTIAMLTPPASGAGYVGHAIMARYLGHLRVEGADLRVVGNKVYLKTINGLHRIDFLIRAVEAHRADPLELAPDGFEGAVGLVEACRQDPELVVNALGTAVAENRGLSGYLEALSQHYIGEPIAIQDSPRLWLGDPVARDQVLASLDEFVIHEAREGTGSPGQAAQGRSASGLDAVERAALVDDIKFRGARLVAERPVGFATAPSWTEQGLKPEPFAIRVFIAAIGGEFAAMPGGLAITVDRGSTVALSSADGQSRDVWVVADDRPEPTISLRRTGAQQSHIQRHATALQSRAADDLFWLGRYCERADGILRWLRKSLERNAADILGSSAGEVPMKALRMLAERDASEPSAVVQKAPAQSEHVTVWLEQICADITRPENLGVTLANIRSVALRCRDRLSADSWRILNQLSADGITCHLPAKSANAKVHERASSWLMQDSNDIVDGIDHLVSQLAAFTGLAHENMTRNTGWRFLDIGRRIERARHISELLLLLEFEASNPDAEREDLVFVLQTADSYLTYRSRYRFAPEVAFLFDLLIIDESNPRSLAHQLVRISDEISELPKSSADAIRTPDQRLSFDLLTKVRLADVTELAKVDDNGRRPALRALLEPLIRDLPKLSEALSRQYFSLTDEQPQRLQSRGGR